MPTANVDHHCIGLDLGQRRDHTALAVLSLAAGRPARLTHLNRFPLGTPYTALAGELRRLVAALPGNAPVTLAVDGSGPGLPVVEMLRQAVLPVAVLTAAITSSGASDRPVNGVYAVPRRGLLSRVRVAMETGKLKFPGQYPLREQLRDELANVDLDNRSDSHHDDLVFAIALALWAATLRNPAVLDPG